MVAGLQGRQGEEGVVMREAKGSREGKSAVTSPPLRESFFKAMRDHLPAGTSRRRTSQLPPSYIPKQVMEMAESFRIDKK